MAGYYDNIADGYAELHGQEQLNKLAVVKKHLDIRKDYLLLDVGCGTGISSDFDCNVIGIDPSFEMLRKSRKPKVQGVAEKLPFKGKSFDVVIALTSVHNFDDVRKGIMEMRRVAKGQIVISALRKIDKYPEIDSVIRKLLNVRKVVMEEKDAIYFCEV